MWNRTACYACVVKKDHAYQNEVDLSFTWRKEIVHVARTHIRRARSADHPRILHLYLPRAEKESHHGRQTLIHLQLTRALALAAPVVSGSAGYLPVDLSIECITFAHVNIARISGRKMARVVRPQRLTP